MSKGKGRRMSLSQRGEERSQRRMRNYIFFLSFVLTIFVLCFGYYFFASKNVDTEKFFVVSSDNEGVDVLVFDMAQNKMVKVIIPSDASIEAASNYGYWSVVSLWKLGFDEKLEGGLLSRSLLTSMGLPVLYWSSGEMENFYDGNFKSKLSTLFSNFSTNVSFRQKLTLFLFSLRVSGQGHEEVNLADTGILVKDAYGYSVSGNIPNLVYSIFSDPYLSENGISIEVVDESGEALDSIKDALSVLGVKIASVRSSDVSVPHCIVTGEKAVAERIGSFLSCEIVVIEARDSVFSATLELSSEFLDLY